jgi:hypothetical protein
MNFSVLVPSFDPNLCFPFGREGKETLQKGGGGVYNRLWPAIIENRGIYENSRPVRKFVPLSPYILRKEGVPLYIMGFVFHQGME